MNSRVLFFIVSLTACVLAANRSLGQAMKAVTYTEIYNDPYEIHKLYVKLMPIFGEVFQTNITAGYGLEAEYYHKNKLNFIGSFRSSYGGSFDGNLNLAKNSNKAQTNVKSYLYAELGATYHLKDIESDAETRLVLYKSSYKKKNRWAAKVPEKIPVTVKLRKVTGARFGGIYYGTAVNFDQMLKNQDLVLKTKAQEAGGEKTIDSESSVFGYLRGAGIYAGASLSWIKNIAIKPDQSYGVLTDGRIIDVFADLIYMPGLKFDEIIYQKQRVDTEPVEYLPVGGRVGFMGKYNRNFAWSYSGEVGMRPGPKGQNFYLLVKIALPVFGSSLKHEVEAYAR